MQPSHTISPRLARTIVELYEDEGAAWLERLPALIDDCARRWSLTMQPPYPLSYNYVAPAIRADGTPVVLKVGFPSDEIPERDRGAAALRRPWHACSCWRPIPTGARLLLERLTPGTTLVHMEDDEQATAIAAEVMRQLWQGPGGGAPPEYPFPNSRRLGRWDAEAARAFRRRHRALPARAGRRSRVAVRRAAGIAGRAGAAARRPASREHPCRHTRALAGDRPQGRGRRAGLRGRRAAAQLAADTLRHGRPARATARRVDQLAEALGFDRARIRGWGLAQAVLSAWWSYRGLMGYGWEQTIACAELLAGLM